MFDFTAYFWDNKVYIDGETYCNNEILTACLNTETEVLADHVVALEKLRRELLLREDPGYDFCEKYNGYVQRAQRIFFAIDETVRAIPPYKSLFMNKPDSPALFDCLNKKFIYWEDGFEGDDYDDIKEDDDYADEYGFITHDGEGNHFFYHQAFTPPLVLLEDASPNMILAIRETNEAINALFDAYITMARDLLRTIAYGKLLEGYIHKERRFLKEDEIAARFIQYLKDVERKNDPSRVSFSGSMQMSYEVYMPKGGKEHLCETYRFDSLGAFLYVDFFHGLNRNYLPKRCENCGRYFLMTAGKYINYCDRPLKGDREKTCRDVGARRKYDDKCKSDPVWLAYNRAYKAHYARYMKKKMTTAEFEQWSRYAVELRDSAEAGTLEFEEYQAILKK